MWRCRIRICICSHKLLKLLMYCSLPFSCSTSILKWIRFTRACSASLLSSSSSDHLLTSASSWPELFLVLFSSSLPSQSAPPRRPTPFSIWLLLPIPPITSPVTLPRLGWCPHSMVPWVPLSAHSWHTCNYLLINYSASICMKAVFLTTLSITWE